MFNFNGSLDASGYDKSESIYQNNFFKVIELIVHCYNLILENENPQKFEKGFRLENYFTNILVGYLKKNKHSFDLKNLGFEIEVGVIKIDSKNVKFIDIKVTNASHYFLGEYDEDIYYAIECKRLDEYSQKIQYYIEGGILRFVNADYSKNLPLAIMIGYVEKGDLSIIVNKINEKLDHRPSDIKTLQKLTERSVISTFNSCYCSKHLKNDNLGKINLYHLLLNYESLITT